MTEFWKYSKARQVDPKEVNWIPSHGTTYCLFPVPEEVEMYEKIEEQNQMFYTLKESFEYHFMHRKLMVILHKFQDKELQIKLGQSTKGNSEEGAQIMCDSCVAWFSSQGNSADPWVCEYCR